MGRMVQPAAKGIDAIISIDSTPLAGQKNVLFNRMAVMESITNEIDKSWSRSIPSTKSWTVNCNGMFIKNEDAFKSLEDAFFNGDELNITLQGNGRKYEGLCHISQFPLSANYSDTLTYSLTFVGCGELTIED